MTYTLFFWRVSLRRRFRYQQRCNSVYCFFSSDPEDQDAEAVILCVWCRGNFRGFSQTEACYRRLCPLFAVLGRSEYRWSWFILIVGHWKGVEHTRLEQKYRIMTQRPLLDKCCRAVTAEEDQRIWRERMSEPPAFVESELSLTVEERIAIEEEEEEESQRPQLSEGSTNYLWLCNFVVAFANSTSFDGVLRLVDGWCACTSAESRFECRTLNYPRCQVRVGSVTLLCV